MIEGTSAFLSASRTVVDEEIAVVGTGTMGAPIARNLARAGARVRAWNRSAAPLAALTKSSVLAARDATEAADGAGILVTMLPTADSVCEVVATQVLGALADGAVWIQMGTIGEAGTAAAIEAASAAGVGFVDAPVLGTRVPAELGQLVVLASGEAGDIDRVQPVFDVIGGRTIRYGAAGASSRVKIVLNTWLAFLYEGIAETAALSEAVGVELDLLLHTIEGGPLAASAAVGKLNRIVADDYSTDFALCWAAKDLAMARESAAIRGLSLPVVDAINDRWHEAIEAGLGEQDVIATHQLLR